MNKRWVLNLGLMILIITLGLFAWFKPGIKTPPVEPALTTLNAADIHNIEIVRPDQPNIRLQRQNNRWRMLAPRNVAADGYLVKAFLDSLAVPTLRHFKVETAELDKFGLAKPQLQLRLNDSEIDFGTTEPLDGNRYAKVGDTVYLTTGELFYRLSHDALWWVDKQLLPTGAHITALQLPDATLTLQNGKWQLAPANPAISADAIQKLVDAWHDARALSVLTPEAGKSSGEVAIQLAGQSRPLRFNILDNPNFLLLVRPDLKLEYRLEQDQRKALLELQPTSAGKTATGHNGAKESPDARTAGSRNHPPGH